MATWQDRFSVLVEAFFDPVPSVSGDSGAIEVTVHDDAVPDQRPHIDKQTAQAVLNLILEAAAAVFPDLPASPVISTPAVQSPLLSPTASPSISAPAPAAETVSYPLPAVLSSPVRAVTRFLGPPLFPSSPPHTDTSATSIASASSTTPATPVIVLSRELLAEIEELKRATRHAVHLRKAAARMRHVEETVAQAHQLRNRRDESAGDRDFSPAEMDVLSKFAHGTWDLSRTAELWRSLWATHFPFLLHAAAAARRGRPDRVVEDHPMYLLPPEGNVMLPFLTGFRVLVETQASNELIDHTVGWLLEDEVLAETIAVNPVAVDEMIRFFVLTLRGDIRTVVASGATGYAHGALRLWVLPASLPRDILELLLTTVPLPRPTKTKHTGLGSETQAQTWIGTARESAIGMATFSDDLMDPAPIRHCAAILLFENRAQPEVLGAARDFLSASVSMPLEVATSFLRARIAQRRVRGHASDSINAPYSPAGRFGSQTFVAACTAPGMMLRLGHVAARAANASVHDTAQVAALPDWESLIPRHRRLWWCPFV